MCPAASAGSSNSGRHRTDRRRRILRPCQCSRNHGQSDDQSASSSPIHVASQTMVSRLSPIALAGPGKTGRELCANAARSSRHSARHGVPFRTCTFRREGVPPSTAPARARLPREAASPPLQKERALRRDGGRDALPPERPVRDNGDGPLGTVSDVLEHPRAPCQSAERRTRHPSPQAKAP